MAVDVNLEKELERLGQTHNLKKLREVPAITELLTVQLIDKTEVHTFYIDCALIPNDSVESCLAKPTIDLLPERGIPGATRYHNGDSVEVKYFRFGNDDGFEPLVLCRSFHNLRPEHYEMSEEFRLFHNLFHNRKPDEYFKIDDAGNDELVAVVTENSVRIRLREIRQFLAVKEMHLVVQFDYREHSPQTLKDLGIQPAEPTLQRDGLSCWDVSYTDIGMKGCRGSSRLLGKTFVKPLPKEKSGFWGFATEEPESYADFIIAVNDDGENIMCSAEPAAMGAHPRKPDYLTRVDFKKTVLDKYYQHPRKYGVEDGYLRCGSLWGLMMDNHHSDKVSAWLGDLGRDLPYGEQLHWKSHNIPPQGGVSSTFFRRQIMAEFVDSNSPDHRFQQSYTSLQKTSLEIVGWSFLTMLVAEDEHHLSGLRIPATDEQKDFDEVILSLTKVLIDYMNEKTLKQFVCKKPDDELKPGGINLLERVFKDLSVPDTEVHIEFLRELQKIRSKGSAHQKGSDYKKLIAESGGDAGGLRSVIERLLRQATDFVEFVEGVIEHGYFQPKK